MFRHSISHSPSAIHAAALTRSLSIVAAMQQEDEARLRLPQFRIDLEPADAPTFSSAFSDYGSSECSSVAYTPSEAGSEGYDPFQFDNISLSLGREPPTQAPTEPPPDNFNLFERAQDERL